MSIIDKQGTLKRIDYGDTLYLDMTEGIAGTTYPIGTADMPSNVPANLFTIAAALGIYAIYWRGSSALPGNSYLYNFYGRNRADIIALNGQITDRASFNGPFTITGARGGTAPVTEQTFFNDCHLSAVTNINGVLRRCTLSGACSLIAASFDILEDCQSDDATLTLGTPSLCEITGLSGRVTLAGLTGGADVVNIHCVGGAVITIAASCVANTINVYGQGTVVDNSVGTVVNDYTIDNNVAIVTALGGFGSGLVTKTLTFANNNGQVPLFTVTGDVLVRMVAIVQTVCASGGCNVSVGIAAIVDAMLPVTDITLLAQGEIWHDATPDKEIEAMSTMREYIVADGEDITLNSSAADNSGEIAFYCFWTALSSGATVVAA